VITAGGFVTAYSFKFQISSPFLSCLSIIISSFLRLLPCTHFPFLSSPSTLLFFFPPHLSLCSVFSYSPSPFCLLFRPYLLFPTVHAYHFPSCLSCDRKHVTTAARYVIEYRTSCDVLTACLAYRAHSARRQRC